ncbi:hypothetical protein BDN70DRAFT_412789 [Pholiota conissans]|uniref:Uncharacterized protein n=1 Tax=Pholiota conissans TaxID=109636 RepID=A0A9P6CUF6_9AGAR|nr:hypothetical protein BDN70DRAFT_412789 [Pholiota conissans]
MAGIWMLSVFSCIPSYAFMVLGSTLICPSSILCYYLPIALFCGSSHISLLLTRLKRITRPSRPVRNDQFEYMR